MFQYTAGQWATALAQLNTQYGTNYTTAQLTSGIANAILTRGAVDAEQERLAKALYDNALAMRTGLNALDPTDPAIPYLTDFMTNLHNRWPLGIPTPPAVS